MASFRITTRSPIPAGASASPVWSPRSNKSWLQFSPYARRFCPCYSWATNMEKLRPFFSSPASRTPDLATAVREGRKRELGRTLLESDFADPQAESTFERSRLDWSKLDVSPHSEILRLHRDLISLRKQHPALANCRKDLTEIQFDERSKYLVMKRADPSGNAALLVCNFSGDAQTIPLVVEAQVWAPRPANRRPDLRRQSRPWTDQNAGGRLQWHSSDAV